jgi:hypothetical protein
MEPGGGNKHDRDDQDRKVIKDQESRPRKEDGDIGSDEAVDEPRREAVSDARRED